ncbi:MAG: hypothetical protein PF444_02995 [Bacteroidales bacterium]|jgi:hypothetical protein|nr:hypothetical protein [Bacteroidales bacterium]
MKKYNLQDITFLIPFRLDSKIRLENLLLILDYLCVHFDTNITIMEADRYPSSFLDALLPENVKYQFLKDEDPVFHRTAHINYMLKGCNTPLVAVWDTDVIVLPQQLIDAVNFIRSGKAQFASPYKGQFLDTSDIIREQYLYNKDDSYLVKHQNKMKSLYTDKAVGGGFVAQTSAYKESGGENEFFYGWGYRRWRKS